MKYVVVIDVDARLSPDMSIDNVCREINGVLRNSPVDVKVYPLSEMIAC